MQELAWASYALLRNTNVSGLLVWQDGAVLMARGSLGPARKAADSASALAALAEARQDSIVDNAAAQTQYTGRCACAW